MLAIGVLVVAIGAGAYIVNKHAGQNASASTPNYCAQNGTGYCLNDWNGLGWGNWVKMYSAGASNEDFITRDAGNCPTVTSSCPFSGKSWSGSWNKSLLNKHVQEIRDSTNSLCVGTGVQDSRTFLKDCVSNPTTLFVRSGTTMINVSWTNQYNLAQILCSGGAIGVAAVVTDAPTYNSSTNQTSTGGCEWATRP
jgi:hypothetical protein